MTANSTAMLQMAHLHIDEQIRSAEHSRLARQVRAAERRTVRPFTGRKRGLRSRW